MSVHRSIRRGPSSPLALATAVAATAMLAPAGNAGAGTFSWDNDRQDALWESSSNGVTNWDPDGVPGAGDTAIIEGFDVVINQADASVATLIHTGGALTLSRTLSITGGGSLDTLHLRAGVLDADGIVILAGEGSWRGGSFTGAAGISNAGSFTVLSPDPSHSNVMFDTTFTNNSSGTFSQDFAWRLANAVFVNNGRYNAAMASVSGDANSQFENYGQIIGEGTATIGAKLINSGSISASGPGTLLSLMLGSNFQGGSIGVANGGTMSLAGFNEHLFSGAIKAEGNGVVEFGGGAPFHIDGSFTANLSGPLASKSELLLSSGTTTGPGALTNQGRAFWGGTVISNAGGLINEAPGGGGNSFFIQGTGTRTINSKLINKGQVSHFSAAVVLSAGAELDNQFGAAYDLRGQGVNGVSISGPGTFKNAGVVTKLGVNSSSVSSRLNLSGGLIDVEEGTLQLDGSGGGSGGFFQVASDANLNLTGNYVFDRNYSFSGQGNLLLRRATFQDGTATLDMTGPAGTTYNDTNGWFITLSNATLQNKGIMTWSGSGGIDSLGSGKFVNAAGGTLGLVNSPLLSAPLENLGTINQAANSGVRIDTGGALTNRKDYNVTIGQIGTNGVGPHLLENRSGGMFRKSGTGQFLIDMPFSNRGGTLALEGVPFGSASNVTLQRGGAHENGAVFRVGDYTELHLFQNHAFNGDASFEGNGKTVLRGNMSVSGGTAHLDHAGNAGGEFLLNDSSATLSTGAAGLITLAGRTRWNAATITGGQVANGVATGGVINTGELRILTASNANLHVISNGILHNAGTVVQYSGDIHLANGGVFFNTGTYRTDGIVSPEYRFIPLAGGGRVENHGNIHVDRVLSVEVPFHFHAGVMNVSGHSSAHLRLSDGGLSTGSGTFQLDAPEGLHFAGGVHSFDGTFTAVGNSNVRVSGGQVLGDLEVNLSSGALIVSGGAVGGPQSHPLVNRRVTTWQNGTVTGAGGFSSFGTLNITGGMTLAGRLSNAGVALQQAGVTFGPGSGHMLRNQSTGEWIQTAPISGSVLDLIDNQGEFFSGDGTSRTFTIIPRFDNDGTLIVLPNTSLHLAGPVDQYDAAAGTLTGGIWEINTGGVLTLGAGQPLQMLDATVNLAAGATFTNLPRLIRGDFTNRGTLALRDTYRFAGTYLNEGLTFVDNGAALETVDFTNRGQVGGDGSIGDETGTIFNQGKFTPGQSPGTLTIIGDLVSDTSASLEIEIEGAAADLQHDLLVIDGNAALDGTLELLLPLGFATPLDAADTLTILTADAITGTFHNIDPDGTILSADGFGRFNVNVGTSSVTLSGFQAVPEPAGVLWMGAAALLGMLRRRGRHMMG